MKEQLQVCTCTHIFSEDEDIEPIFNYSPDLSFFQAFTFIFLWSRKMLVLSAVSTLYLNSFATLQDGLDGNWWWEWKLHMFRIC
jgi:hypothetical protein